MFRIPSTTAFASFAVACIFFLLPCSAADAADIYVPDDHATIQGAIDASQNGDVIVVRPGTYAENLDFCGKAVTVTSEAGPGRTIIDGMENGSVVVFITNEGPDSVLNGFTVTNGSGTVNETNTHKYGGGVYCDGSGPTVSNNIITQNSVGGEGYGFCRGGGVACISDGSLSATVFNNEISHNFVQGYGGGVCCQGGFPLVSNNVIHHNTAEDWSWLDGDRPPHSYVYGGGAYFSVSGGTLINNTVCRNEVAGLETYGSGIYSWSSALKIVNTIVWDNQGMWYQLEGYAQVMYCDIQGGGWPGPGNINSIPIFVDSPASDFHIHSSSPCRDAGTDSVVGLPDEDFEGDPRCALGQVDMGADEFYRHLYFTGDPTPGGSVEVKITNMPQTKPVMLGVNLELADPPFKTQYGMFYLDLPMTLLLTFDKIPPGGVLVLPGLIPSNFPAPLSVYMQALTGDSFTNYCEMYVE